MKRNLKKMWRWLSKRLGNYQPGTGSAPTGTRVTTQDDYLAEEVVLRAIAFARDGNPELDLVERFAAAAAYVELPPQVRIFHLKLPAKFIIAHPVLAIQQVAVKYALRHPPSVETTGTQISMSRRCQKLLDDIELGNKMSEQAGRAARHLAQKCNWTAHQLRNAIEMGILIDSSTSQRRIEVRAPNKIHSATTTFAGVFFVISAIFFITYGVFRSVRCGNLDCVQVGCSQLATIGLVLGIPSLRYCRTRKSLYMNARRFVT